TLFGAYVDSSDGFDNVVEYRFAAIAVDKLVTQHARRRCAGWLSRFSFRNRALKLFVDLVCLLIIAGEITHKEDVVGDLVELGELRVHPIDTNTGASQDVEHVTLRRSP